MTAKKLSMKVWRSGIEAVLLVHKRGPASIALGSERQGLIPKKHKNRKRKSEQDIIGDGFKDVQTC